MPVAVAAVLRFLQQYIQEGPLDQEVVGLAKQGQQALLETELRIQAVVAVVVLGNVVAAAGLELLLFLTQEQHK
jgi:hypothetical protein